MKTYQVVRPIRTRQGDFVITEPKVVTVQAEKCEVQDGALVFYKDGPFLAFSPGQWEFFEEVSQETEVQL